MNRLARSFIPILILLVSTGLTTAAAPASEEPPVVRALLDSTAINAGVRPTYGSLDVAADGTITLSGLKTTYRADDDPDMAMSYEIETLVLADVTEVASGLFEVGAAEWLHTTVMAGDDSIAAIPLITAKSLYVHRPVEEPTAIERMRASNVLAKEFAMPEALVLIGGQGIVLEGLSGTWQGDPMTGAGTSRFVARRIHIPEGVFPDDDNPLAMAGYSELELAVDGISVITHASDAVDFELAMRLDGRDVGSLIIELGADGIPLGLFTSVDTAEANPDALLGMAEGVSLKRVSIRFEDDSLTGRLLSLMAEIEGTDVDTVVAGMVEDLESVVELEFSDDQLARQIAQALTDFLNEPRSITFALTPAQPVHFAQVMAGLEDPMTLIDLLRLSVTAND